jgi:hypothetical protein
MTFARGRLDSVAVPATKAYRFNGTYIAQMSDLAGDTNTQ